MPGEGLTHGPPATKNAGGSHHRCSRTSGIPCAAVLTLIRALLGDRLDCPRHWRDAKHRANLAPAPGRQDHTTSRPYRRRSSARSDRAATRYVYRIPASRVVTTARNAPLVEAGFGHHPRFLQKRKRNFSLQPSHVQLHLEFPCKTNFCAQAIFTLSWRRKALRSRMATRRFARRADNTTHAAWSPTPFARKEAIAGAPLSRPQDNRIWRGTERAAGRRPSVETAAYGGLLRARAFWRRDPNPHGESVALATRLRDDASHRLENHEAPGMVSHMRLRCGLPKDHSWKSTVLTS
jgi:hypothetical protein